MYAVLAVEPDNPYDANAVAVWIQSLKVGYLSREDARRYRPGLLAMEQQHGKPIALAGVVAGGGMRADGPDRLDVFLKHDPADLGLRLAGGVTQVEVWCWWRSAAAPATVRRVVLFQDEDAADDGHDYQ